MRRLFQQVFDVSRYDSLIEKDRARLVYVISSVMFGLASIFMLVAITTPQYVFGEKLGNLGVFSLLFGLFFLGIVAAVAVTRQGKNNLGGLIIVVLGTISFGWLSVSSGAYTMQDGMLMLVIL